MTVKEFLEKYDGAPYMLYEVAELVSEITDDTNFADSAKAFLEVKENFEIILDDIGFEFG